VWGKGRRRTEDKERKNEKGRKRRKNEIKGQTSRKWKKR
jgi:hypothetical protein